MIYTKAEGREFNPRRVQALVLLDVLPSINDYTSFLIDPTRIFNYLPLELWFTFRS